MYDFVVSKQNVSKPLRSSVVLNLEDQFCAEDSMNAEDPAEEDLDSMLEECSTLYEAVSTLWQDHRFC